VGIYFNRFRAEG